MYSDGRSQAVAIGQKQTFKHYLELSRGTFLKLKGPRMWTFSLLLITC